MPAPPRNNLVLSRRADRRRRWAARLGAAALFLVTAVSALAVLGLFIFVARDAWPFLTGAHLAEFFTRAAWRPAASPPQFGALAILLGSALVTCGAAAIAVPLGVAAAVCLSDILPFHLRQLVKPVIEMLAALPSVAYGFFALVVLAPLLQARGGPLLGWAFLLVAAPPAALAVLAAAERLGRAAPPPRRAVVRVLLVAALGALAALALARVFGALRGVTIASGANALNAALILGIMALPTVVSVSEDALQAAGRDLRMASYAMGATRAETLLRVVLPAAGGGITAAVILGVMRAAGETMVVWMASGNAAQIPAPWYNLLEPVRTLTATIAGEMGEADQVTGSERYHALFAMALVLLVFSFACNGVSEWVVARTRRGRG